MKAMFQHLTDLSYQRSAVQAIGFYLAYFVLALLTFMIIGGIAGIMSPENAAQVGLKAGWIGAIIVSPVLCYFIVKAKNIKGFGYYFLMLLSGGLAIVGGVLFGFVPVAYLTTKKKLKK